MIKRLPVTMALSALLASAAGFPVGRGRKPTSAIPPYYLLYSLDANVSGAPLADENEDAAFFYQITSVSGPDPSKPQSGGSPDQAELMADRAREAVLGRDPVTGLWLHPLTIPGARIHARSLDTEAGATSEPNDAIMTYVQRVRLDLTPA